MNQRMMGNTKKTDIHRAIRTTRADVVEMVHVDELRASRGWQGPKDVAALDLTLGGPNR